ncbi:MAG: prepilin peptidase [Verrucomicrobia bacterium]|nr:MAG: prepilin peptidase [Verrucomicrobiota bacterium]
MIPLPGTLPDPVAFAAVAAFFGLLVGSFLNVVIHRLPKMMERDWVLQCAELRGESLDAAPAVTLVSPRSRCPACGHAISAWENIPVLSYLFLHGKCRACRAPISLRYPLVEVLTAILFAFVAWHFGYTWSAIGGITFCAAMIALAFIDLDTQYLPDDLTLPLLWSGLIFNTWGTYASLSSAVIGAIAGYLSLWLVYWGFKLVTGKEGMGHGDFKLLAAIGAWLGWQVLPLAILLSSFVGALIGIGLIIFTRHAKNVPIPFGPYLAVAGIIAMFWGKPLTQAYLGTQL